MQVLHKEAPSLTQCINLRRTPKDGRGTASPPVPCEAVKRPYYAIVTVVAIVCFDNSQLGLKLPAILRETKGSPQCRLCIQPAGPGGTLQGRKERPTALGLQRIAVSLLLC